MRRTLALITLALVASACEGEPAPPGSPSTQEAVAWSPPTRYVFDLESSCGERSLIGNFRVQVEDGEVQKAMPLDQSARAMISSGFSDEVPTLDALLDEATEATSSGADQVDVRMADDGRPTQIEIDYDENAIDDEVCYFITRFREGGTSRESEIYAAAIRELILKEHVYGRRPSSLRHIYVVSGSLKSAGDPMKSILRAPDARFDHELRSDIETHVGGLSRLEFVSDTRQALSNRRTGAVGNRSVIIVLGPIERKRAKVHLPTTLWCDKCSRWLTYVLGEAEGTWKVIGTTGPYAIS